MNDIETKENVQNICWAYESGVGHKGRKTAAINPYTEGTPEYIAYALGASSSHLNKKVLEETNDFYKEAKKFWHDTGYDLGAVKSIEKFLCNLYEARIIEKQLREMLALSYCGPLLYIDDGELQDNRELPCIDFCRDSVEDLKNKIKQRNINLVLSIDERIKESSNRPDYEKISDYEKWIVEAFGTRFLLRDSCFDLAKLFLLIEKSKEKLPQLTFSKDEVIIRFEGDDND